MLHHGLCRGLEKAENAVLGFPQVEQFSNGIGIMFFNKSIN
ncbi:hypothetical protein COO91_10394 (plasmid) [Nostoc flagelliforme CCNUN1]|uniref:Uncharacterized protein n=1 Tax=Nostoc flagelliforme CCNUN1 TaxID=2038116 RepID=A0A2K8T938_9NOSO|nr:hypothetical protein COO91_10394 [Nostoc flagelliforme CCNUN1]